MSTRFSAVAKKWQEDLAHGGYEKHLKNKIDFYRIKFFSRAWKTILKVTKLKPDASVFEFGCGGGNQLVPLALNGYKCIGIDCSEDVLIRCKNLISDAEKFTKNSLNIQLIYGDFLSYSSSEKFDMVFNFGVIEHFLDDKEREKIIQKMFILCKPGGYVVSVVPNGAHPMRERMKNEGLGGYHIPEIDYDAKLMINEMTKAGVKWVEVIPNNLFGYLLLDPGLPFLQKIIYYSLYYVAQFFPRIKSKVTYKHAGTLICVAKC